MTELRKLIEAVEAGTHNRDVFDMAVSCGFDEDAVDYICVANDGYLDAAKALHEALLPKYEWERTWSGYMKVTRGSREWVCTDAIDPARAWLIAILKAHEAQQ